MTYVTWLAVLLGAVFVLRILRRYNAPRLRDPRLDRDWAGRPGPYDSPR